MQVPLHQFKSHMAKYVADAQNGEIIELTSHRKVVARLTGVTKGADATGIAGLLASGLASWRGGKPVGAEIALPDGGKDMSVMIAEDR